MKPFQKIEYELREAQIKGLETALAVFTDAVARDKGKAPLAAAADEIESLIAALRDQQRGGKLM